MIQLSKLRKEYDDLVAVDDLTLTIPEGEIYGLIGPNGAGKTTTIRMTCGLLAPTQGSVRVDGADVLSHSSGAQGNVGYLSDFFSVYEDLKVWEYLDYFAHAYKMPPADIAKRVEEVIGEVGLEVKRDSLIHGLSRGMKQRLGIARAIIHQPKVLVLDEPASGLDPKARFELRNLLRSLRDRGATVLISSHILTELEGFCTSIGIMERGRLVRSGRIEEITAAEGAAQTVELRWLGEPSVVTNVLRGNAKVSAVELNGSAGSFEFSGSEEQLAQLLADLVKAEARLVSFQSVKRTVEELYLKISGHEVM